MARTPSVWRSGSILPELPRTTSLALYSLRHISPDYRLSIATLAGLVNRGPDRLYLIENADDEFWLNELDPALPRQSVTGKPEELLLRYREHVQGLVLYDPGLPDTVNVACTCAALENGVVVNPAQAELWQAEPYRLPILADLRKYEWKTALQAYAWAAQELLPRCSHELVAGLDPGISACLRAFLATHRVFTCWLDARRMVPHPWQHWLSERRLLRQILASFPPGALHLGWFVSEPFGIRLTSRAGLLTLATDHCTNLEIWSSLPARPQEVAEPVPAIQKELSELPKVVRKPVNLRAGTTYLSFTISDGDNLQYCQHFLLRLWNDRARGQLPLGWTISPALQQVMPAQAAFYRRTASRRDELIAGPSGAGYILPSHWPAPYRTDFLRQTAEYMHDMQLKTLQVLDSRSLFTWFSMRFLNVSLQKLFVEHLYAHGLRGIVSGAGTARLSWREHAGVPVYQNLGLALNKRRALALIQRAIRRGARFINIYIFAWQITPSDLLEIVEQLDDDVQVVTPGRLLELITQARQQAN